GARDGVLGDVPLVNGAVRPVATVFPTLLRLRILNASNARPYRLRRDDGGPLMRIAGDGGLLAAPLAATTVELWPGERVELLLDLGGRYGSSVTLVDDLAFTDGLVRFTTDGRAGSANRTAGAVAMPAGVSEVLAPHPDLPAAEVVREVVLTFDIGSGRWLLNGHGFQSELVDYRCRLGAVERWRLINRAPGSHPMHLHLASFLVRGRIGAYGQDQPLEEGDVGWKDTVVVRPGQVVEVDVRFTDHPGTFVYHCHILEHEDHDMMSQFAVLPVERLAGPTRIDTAVAVARRAFPDGAASVLVAAAADFPDALAAGPVAARLGGPLLLTARDSLPAAVAEEIRRLGPARVVVVGGTAVMSDDVLAALEDLAPVQRIAGTGREATAAALARHAFDRAEQVWLASGTDFPDALVASAAAARDGAPLLLIGRDRIPADTWDALGDLGTTSVVVVGGPAVISPQVETSLAAAGRDVRRLGGGDRFATAAVAAGAPDPPEGVAPAVLLVTGLGFADALAAAPLAAVLGAPLLLADTTLPPVTATAIAASGATRLVVVGGDAVVPVAVEEAAIAWLSPG
ncbi:MAG TPA: cell wall-binding repeat-containing protein, partial [Euzebya sp.]|nr:cell wall-binding repeat-containing protein [Euzebya sp.]